MQMEYRVLNPSYCTWPVYNHLGRVRFTSTSNSTNYHDDETSSGSSVGGCQMEWTVQWTPLPFLLPMIDYYYCWEKILTWITNMVIETAANYMAAATAEQQQQQANEDDDAKNR